MAVSLDATGTAVSNNTVSTSFNFTGITVGAGLTNGALVFCLNLIPAPAADPVCTWDSGGTNAAMTLIGVVTDTTNINGKLYFYGLLNPISGNKTLAVSWTTTSSRYSANAISFAGVNQTFATAFVNFASTDNLSSNTTFSQTVTLSSPGTDYAVCGMCIAGTTVVNTRSDTLWFDITVGTGVGRTDAQYAVAPVGANHSFNWTIAIANFAMTAGFEIQPSLAALSTSFDAKGVRTRRSNFPVSQGPFSLFPTLVPSDLPLAAISGTLTTTEAQDIAAFAGSAVFSGSLATTEAQDIAAFTGSAVFSGSLATTEAQDIAAFTGSAVFSGSLATTEAQDTAAFAGTAQAPGISGTWTTTEAVDIAAFAGSAVFSGTLAAIEAQDIAAFAGSAIITGTLATTEAVDSASFIGAGVVAPTGILLATEFADHLIFTGTHRSPPSLIPPLISKDDYSWFDHEPVDRRSWR